MIVVCLSNSLTLMSTLVSIDIAYFPDCVLYIIIIIHMLIGYSRFDVYLLIDIIVV